MAFQTTHKEVNVKRQKNEQEYLHQFDETCAAKTHSQIKKQTASSTDDSGMLFLGDTKK